VPKRLAGSAAPNALLAAGAEFVGQIQIAPRLRGISNSASRSIWIGPDDRYLKALRATEQPGMGFIKS